jgi:starvation-inducible DNA-binding protein
MKTKKVIDSLNHILADSYALYLKTQNYHWNVTGPHFSSLHALFESQYSDLASAIDELAERIIILGHKVPATFKHFDKKCHIKDGNEKADWKKMVKELSADNSSMSKVIDSCIKDAEKAGDYVTVDMLTERMAIHDKNHWMLSAHLE